MKALTAQDILQAEDLPRKRVEVPEWGGYVNVRTMTGAERDTFEADVFAGNGTDAKSNGKNIRARFLAAVLVDDDGKNIFSIEQAKELGGKSAKILDQLYDASMRLNHLTQADVEDLAKNSASDQGEPSISG